MKQQYLGLVLSVCSIIFGIVLTNIYYKFVDTKGFPMTWEEADQFAGSARQSCDKYFVNQPNYDIALDLALLEKISIHKKEERWEFLIQPLENRLKENTLEMEKRLNTYQNVKDTERASKNIEGVKKYFEQNS